MHYGTRLPYSLRLAILLLRVALGLSFFYLGFSKLFNDSFVSELGQTKALGGFSAWFGAPEHIGLTSTGSKWVLIVIGVGLVIGFATRLLSLLGIIFTGVPYLGNIDFTHLQISQLVNDQLITILCLFVLIFSRAGTYLGFDKFFRFSPWRKK